MLTPSTTLSNLSPGCILILDDGCSRYSRLSCNPSSHLANRQPDYDPRPWTLLRSSMPCRTDKSFPIPRFLSWDFRRESLCSVSAGQSSLHRFIRRMRQLPNSQLRIAPTADLPSVEGCHTSNPVPTLRFLAASPVCSALGLQTLPSAADLRIHRVSWSVRPNPRMFWFPATADD